MHARQPMPGHCNSKMINSNPLWNGPCLSSCFLYCSLDRILPFWSPCLYRSCFPGTLLWRTEVLSLASQYFYGPDLSSVTRGSDFISWSLRLTVNPLHPVLLSPRQLAQRSVFWNWDSFPDNLTSPRAIYCFSSKALWSCQFIYTPTGHRNDTLGVRMS